MTSIDRLLSNTQSWWIAPKMKNVIWFANWIEIEMEYLLSKKRKKRYVKRQKKNTKQIEKAMWKCQLCLSWKKKKKRLAKKKII